MGIMQRVREVFTAPSQAAELREQVRQRDDSLELLGESLSQLELAIEDTGWRHLAVEADMQFSRQGLAAIAQLARLYWLKNPLIKRAVAIQQTYVFGQGINAHATDPAVNVVVQAFWDDPLNQAELTSHQALMMKEAELQIAANLFFVFFTDSSTGAVRVRSIPFAEVDDIISNPEDSKEPWYYIRKRTRRDFDLATGLYTSTPETCYHPDWRYKPVTGKPLLINGYPVRWDAPVYHVATNKLSDMKFGVSELYAAIDWAKAYKDFLQDWATIVRAYSRFAWSFTTAGGKAGVAAVKARLNTTLSADSGIDRNPPPAAASTFIATQGQKMEPIKTAGATTSADDARRLLLMVCAATGIYEHYFGDPSTGNLATSTSMERPMELKFLERRKLFAGILKDILNYVIDANAVAPGGKLNGSVNTDGYGVAQVELGPDFDTEEANPGKPMSRHIDVDFPDLLDHDIAARIGAIVATTTLNGQAPAGTLDLPTFTRLCLNELGEDDVDEVLARLFPKGWEEERAAASAAKLQAQQAAMNDTQKAATEALREALMRFRDNASAA